MERIKSILSFNKQQRVSVLILFCIIILLQTSFYFIVKEKSKISSQEEKEWLSNQIVLDSLKEVKNQNSNKLYPFNPNFITNFKGYKIGMSVEQIKRLHDFREQNKYVNSAKEFQEITGVSDSLLAKISPYFKFPEWINNKKTYPNDFSQKSEYTKHEDTKREIKILDINQATKEDLMSVYGVGDAISDRILKQKELFGEFASMDQINDVWGLSPDVIEKINQKFKVLNMPNVKKIKINEASIKELSVFPYFKYQIARNIVVYRSMNGDIKEEDLSKIKDFPVDKIKIISLYLEF